MAFTLVTTQTILARNAGALYGLTLGSTTMSSLVTQVATTGVDAFLNTVYANSIGNHDTTAVATVLVDNLGITDATMKAQGIAVVAAQLNGVAYTARGAVINNILSEFSKLSDATWGPLATAYNTKVANAEAYAAVTGNTSNTGFSTTPSTSSGSSFVFTTNIDGLIGSVGNDTFIGDAATLSNADQVDGGQGTDTLKMYGTAGAADVPTMTSIENIYLSGATAGHSFVNNSSVTSLAIDAAATGQIFTVGAAVTALSDANQAAADTVEFKVDAAATSVSITVDKVGTSTGDAILKLDGAALTTINLTASGNASYVELGDGTAAVADTVTTVNVAGDKAVKVDMQTTTAFNKVVTVNASANTGGVNAVMETTTGADVTFTGGTGNDTANFGDKLTKADKVDGGSGTDTLAITQTSVTVVEGYVVADKDALNTNLAGLEVLKVTNALTSNLDASRYDSVNSFVLAAGFNPAATSTLSSVASGVSVEINNSAGNATDILAVAITNATLAGNNSDTVNLKLNDTDTAGAAVTDYGVLNGVGVDILNIQSTKTSTSVATGSRMDIKATSSALDKIVVTGDLYLDINDVALVNSIAEVDASGMTMAATANGIDVSIATGGTNGVKITGSTGIDTIVGGDAADIISTGTGNDVITAGKGDDVITSGAGNDVIHFAAADSSITSTAFDTVTDYTNGSVVNTTDKLVFDTTAGVVGVTALAGWTLNAGVATKTNATVADFIAAVQAAAYGAGETYAFVSGSDTYVYNGGAANADTTDDTFIKLTGVAITSVVVADTTATNELFIA